MSALAGARRALAAALLGALGASLAPAAAAGTFNITFENDRAANTDRHYTHGTLLTWTSEAGAVPRGLADLGTALPGLVDRPDRYSILAGQTMFTPDNIGASRPILDDRPYAGWLYGGLRLTSEQRQARQRLELNLGIVGPPSLADETQTLVHEIINAQIPNGWENQLKTEPGVVLIYERGWRHIQDVPKLGLETAIMPHVSAAVGNVFTLGGLGGRVAIGERLDASWGPPRIFPAMRGSGYGVPAEGWHWSVFLGFEARGVGRNIFLDGNTFASSQDVPKNNLVGDIQAGVQIAHPPVRLAFTYVGRSREFEGQNENDQFGSMTLSIRF
jgi:hypothetical protein